MISIKSKNYDFYQKSRTLKTNPTGEHPLKFQTLIKKAVQADDLSPNKLNNEERFHDPLAANRLIIKQSRQSEIKTLSKSTSLTLSDSKAESPLKKQNTLMAQSIMTSKPSTATMNDPLNKSISPLPSKQDDKSITKGNDKIDESVVIVEDEDDGTDINNLSEFKTASLANVWDDEMRPLFVKTFNIKHLDRLKIRNPFKEEKLKDDRNAVKSLKSGKDNNTLTQEILPQKVLTTSYLSYSNYIKSIEAIKRNIMRAWAKNDKVLALQYTIQGLKLLIDTEEASFYPVKYVYVIDLIEVFSKLVFERIKKLSFPNCSDFELTKIKESNINEANINEAAKDICKNWFLKCAVIRELVPRIYIEACLIRNYVFLKKDKIKSSLLRLTMSLRGITDPLVAAYASAYLIRIGLELLPKEKAYMRSILNDFLVVMKDGARFSHKNFLFEDYFKLFEPSLETLFKFYTQNCDEEDFKSMLKTYELSHQHFEILKKIILCFSPRLIANHTIDVNKFILAHQIKHRIELYIILCQVFGKCMPSKSVIASLFQQFYADITEIKDFIPFLNFIAVLLDFISKSHQDFTKTQFLNSILIKFTEFFTKIDLSVPDNKNAEVLIKLQEFMEKIIESCQEISEILTLEPFLQFVTYLPSEMRNNICKKFLNLFATSNTKISDPICVHSLLSIARNVNDNYGISMSNDEKKHVSELIKKFLNNVDYGRDLEQALNLYTDVRAYFGNLPGVIEILVTNQLSLNQFHPIIYKVFKGLDLSIKCKKYSKGRITKKLQTFLQATISFCLISIPSIDNLVVQFDLYLLTAEVALQFNLTNQSEALFKSAVSLLTEMPSLYGEQAIESVMRLRIKNLISFLIILPENPENDALHNYIGLYNGLLAFFKDKNDETHNKSAALTDCLIYLCISLQEKLPYHVENVKSNDSLYTDAEYKTSIFKAIEKLLSDLQDSVTEVGNSKQRNDNQIINSNLYIINTLLTYILPCQKIKDIIQECCNNIKKSINYMKEKNLKFGSSNRYIVNTFRNLEKNFPDESYNVLMEEIKRLSGISN